MISNKIEPHAICKTFSTNKIMEINAATSLKEKIVKVKISRLVFPENITFRSEEKERYSQVFKNLKNNYPCVILGKIKVDLEMNPTKDLKQRKSQNNTSNQFNRKVISKTITNIFTKQKVNILSKILI